MKIVSTGWNFVRFLRLTLGIAILVQGIVGKDATSMVLGVLFGGMAIANIGCCGERGCPVNITSNNKAKRTNNEELAAGL